MLLAREISCSRSNVLVPVSAWSSPAESVSRSRCSSVISEMVTSYSSFSSSRRAARATRIFSVSAALREVLGATRVALASLAGACLVGVVLVSAGLPIVAPFAASSAAIGGAWSVVPAVLLSATPAGAVDGSSGTGWAGADVAGVVTTAPPSDTARVDFFVVMSAAFSTGCAVVAGAALRTGPAAFAGVVFFAGADLAGVAFAVAVFFAVAAVVFRTGIALVAAFFAGAAFLTGAAFVAGAAFLTGADLVVAFLA